MTMNALARRNRLLLVAAGVAIAAALLVVARGPLFPFILTGILAYVLYPIVSAVESRMPGRLRWPNLSRVVAIWLVFALVLVVLGGTLALIVPPTLGQAADFVDEVPDYYGRARAAIEDWNAEYTERVPEDIRMQVEEYAADSGSILISAARTVILRTLGAVSNVVSTVIGLAVVPFLLFYLLKDRERAVSGIHSLMPPAARRHAVNVIAIVNRVVGAYIRAQLTLGVIVGIVVSVGLFLLGIKFSMLLGIVAGFTELIPIIGPVLGAIPGVFVTLATSPEKVLWVVLLYAGVQAVENVVLVPRIQGHAVGVHPAIVMIALMVGSEAAGLWGVFLSVPVTAVGRDAFNYFHAEWSDPKEPVEPSGGESPDESEEAPEEADEETS